MALYQADTDFYILNDNHLHDATEFDVPAGVKRTAYQWLDLSFFSGKWLCNVYQIDCPKPETPKSHNQ